MMALMMMVIVCAHYRGTLVTYYKPGSDAGVKLYVSTNRSNT